ncbi:hypothetical protein HC928_01365 [bacterium]|nr:hypothetical protein [bacterium]
MTSTPAPHQDETPAATDRTTGLDMPADFNGPATAAICRNDPDAIEEATGEAVALQSEINRLNALLADARIRAQKAEVLAVNLEDQVRRLEAETALHNRAVEDLKAQLAPPSSEEQVLVLRNVAAHALAGHLKRGYSVLHLQFGEGSEAPLNAVLRYRASEARKPAAQAEVKRPTPFEAAAFNTPPPVFAEGAEMSVVTDTTQPPLVDISVKAVTSRLFTIDQVRAIRAAEELLNMAHLHMIAAQGRAS